MWLEIPDDLRAFMRQVVSYLDAPGDKVLDAEDALRDPVGYGGRIDHHDTYRFRYRSSDGHHEWDLVLREMAIRNIANGMVIEIEGERHDIVQTKRRSPTGDPLMVWGESRDDALHVRNHGELVTALDAFSALASERPRMLRMWSASDDQVVAVVLGDRCALYVVESPAGYATSTGDQARNDSFELLDHDGQPLAVPCADCVPWDRARTALLQFVDHGTLGPEIGVEGRIPSVLLMMGDIDRKVALAARGEAPRSLARSSLQRMVTSIPELVAAQDDLTAPVENPPLRLEVLAAWAHRLLKQLGSWELVELAAPANLDELSHQLGNLLQAHGVEAERSLDTAEWLANEISGVRGVSRLFATGGDLQAALRRSRETDS